MPKKYRPTDSQKAAARDLINSLDLMSGSVDESGNQTEALKPKHTFNPVLQHFYQSVQNRALDKNRPIDELDPVIKSYINPDQQLKERASQAITNFRQNFLLQKVEQQKKGPKRHWRDYLDLQMADADVEAAAKRAREGKEDESTSSISYDNLVQKTVDEIGSVDPVGDFQAMLKRRDDARIISKAIAEMSDLIIRLVNTSLGDSQYHKAFACLKELRQGSIQHDEVETFNTYLVNLVKQFQNVRGKQGWVCCLLPFR
jgi:ATP-dependent DNA helicase 2 subunit 2